MSTVTVVATAEPSTDPQDAPRVRLNITDTGTPAITSVTVTRLNPDGTVVPVRTADGLPLTLTTSGADRVGLLYDYEMPLAAPVSFSTLENPASVATVTVAESRVWLVHPGVPELSVPVRFRRGSFAAEDWSIEQGVFRPMGRATPIVVTAGARSSAAGSFTIAVDNLAQLEALRQLFADGAPLLLNAPATSGWGIDTAYIAVGGVKVSRTISGILIHPDRDVEVTYVVVDRPVGGSQAERTYADLLDYPTYADLMAAYPTYAGVLAGP